MLIRSSLSAITRVLMRRRDSRIVQTVIGAAASRSRDTWAVRGANSDSVAQSLRKPLRRASPLDITPARAINDIRRELPILSASNATEWIDNEFPSVRAIGRQKRDPCVAIRTSHAADSNSPAPAHTPSMTARVGTHFLEFGQYADEPAFVVEPVVKAREGLKVANVGARRERLSPSTSESEQPNLAVGVGAPAGSGNGVVHLRGQCVALFRPVEHDVEGLATTDDQDFFVRFNHDTHVISGREKSKHIALEYLCEFSMQSCR